MRKERTGGETETAPEMQKPGIIHQNEEDFSQIHCGASKSTSDWVNLESTANLLQERERAEKNH